MFGLFSSSRRKQLAEQMRTVIRESKGVIPQGKEGEDPEALLAVIKNDLLREQAARLGILQSLTMPFFYAECRDTGRPAPNDNKRSMPREGIVPCPAPDRCTA
jgi:hypothetical protein